MSSLENGPSVYSPGMSQARSLFDKALRAAREDGYRAALADVERVVYEGEEALFALLANAR